MNRRLSALLGRVGEWTQTDGSEATESKPSATLYRCRECEETYISREMESCPRCDRTVEAIPDERDLGFGPGETSP